jgi:coenzyme F420-dependent glucose-6-phosphate dehydrogenase
VIKFGYKASAEQFGPRELVELGVLAEEHGMHSATVSDHFQPWRHNGGHAPFSLAWMTAVGERTSRLQLGTSVMTPTFRYNPAVVAQAFATMGCLYPGRIALGVGTGEALNEIATGFAAPWPDFKERFARPREAVALMRELWLGDRVDFEGNYYADPSVSRCRVEPPRLRARIRPEAVPGVVREGPRAPAASTAMTIDVRRTRLWKKLSEQQHVVAAWTCLVARERNTDYKFVRPPQV